MPTIEQIRAARALIGWSQSDLADKAGLSQTGIARIENGTNHPNATTTNKILTAFDSADVEFIGDSGVKKRTSEVVTLEGKTGFIRFLDEVYETVSEKGGLVCLHNANPENWYKWVGEDFYNAHAQRMSKIEKDFEFRITTRVGEDNFISSSFAEYRFIPSEMFNDQSIYAYGDSLAFINFGSDSVAVHILKNSYFSQGFQALFNIAWDRVAKKST